MGWQQQKAPHASKRWFSRYSWIFLLICLVTGGVHPALELTNSMLWPRQLFCMHLPYSELIRVRTERFVTNVLTENFPFLILQISYYFIADSIESRLNDANIVFWGTVASSVLSVLFSGTYYFSYKYQLQSAIATYSFSFGFRTDEFEHYWVHSHWRLQTALSKALQIGTPSLVVIDNVIDAQKKDKKKFLKDENKLSMYIEGRILHNPGSVKSKLKMMELDLKMNEQAQQQEMTEIVTTLLQVLRNEFSLERTTDEVKIINLRIKNINKGDGERMFELDYEDTMKNICCWRCGSVTKENSTQMKIPNAIESSQFVGYAEDQSEGNLNEKNGIYVADETKNTVQANTKPANYSVNGELPMVSITTDLNKPTESNKKHRLQFSTISAIISADPGTLDQLRDSYRD